jgi:hypothetical protein
MTASSSCDAGASLRASLGPSGAARNKYQFADVGLRVKGEWVKGLLSVKRASGAGAPYSLEFDPSDVAQEEHGLSLSESDLLAVDNCANNEARGQDQGLAVQP